MSLQIQIQMKQQNKRPPKPKKQANPSAAQPQTSKATLTKNSGKENSADMNKDHQLHQATKYSIEREKEQIQGSKQRFKSSNGANNNRSSSQQDTKRPHLTSTLVVGSGHTQLDHQLKAQRQLNSAMGNTTKDYLQNDKREPVIQDIEIATYGKNLLKENMLENSIGGWLQKQQSQAESKYSSTRNKHQLLDRHFEAAITGRKVDQPKVFVGDVDTHDVFNNLRFSPQRDKQTTTAQLPLQIRKASKKSKSQTIQGSIINTHKNAWAKRGNKPQRMMEFLDSSLLNPGFHNESFRINDEPIPKREEVNERDMTLKILTQTADNINLSQSKSGQRQRPRSMERSKVQMKYLNFHRENVLKSQSRQNKTGAGFPKRCTTALNAVHSNRNYEKDLNKTQSTSADRIHRLAGTQSPLSKSGVIKQHKDLQKHQKKQKKETNQLTKSANEMQAAISSLVLPAQKNDSDKAMLYFKQPAQQNNSTMPGPNDQSQISLVPSNHKLSQQNVKKHKTSISPERAAKIDKFIRENIRREKQVQENRRREQKQREASSVRRKQQLEQKNQHIRQLNRDKMQRRRLKLKENLTISGDEQDQNEIQQLERALLAVGDGVQNNEPTNKNFDSRSSQKVFSRGGLRTQQLGQVPSSLKMQLAKLQAADDLNAIHRKSQGMDFIDIRREISNELKGGKSSGGIKTLKKDVLNGVSLIDSVFMLQTSKSQKQEFVPLRSQVNQTSVSIHQGLLPAQNDKKSNQLTQVKQENMLFKRNQIRKFMREKAKLMQTRVDQQKAEEISTFKKVRHNLTKLNNFVQKRFGQMQISGITTPALKVKRQHKKNITVVYDEKDVIKTTALRQNRHQDRTITPTKASLFENSDASLNISGKNARGRSVLGQQTHKDFQKLHETLYQDSRMNSIQTLEERSIKRGGGAGQSTLGVCFEKSASSKALRKQLHASPIPESRNSSKKRPRSALNISSVGRSIKRKIKSAKRSKSQSGVNKIYLPAQGKLTVKLPAQNREESEENDEADYHKMTDSTAAKVIQKEVRKYLSNLGFYEARQVEDQTDAQGSPGLTSHNNSQQINLFIEPVKSRDRSPSRLKHSGSSKRKTRVAQYSPDYELIEPSSRKKNDSLKLSPLKQLKQSKIEKLNVDESDNNNSRTRKNQSNHSSEEAQNSSQKRRDNIKLDVDSISNAVKTSAERKRASAEVKNTQQLGLLGLNKPSRQLKPQEYHVSSHGSSQLPGIHSVTTPQSSQHILVGNQKSNQVSSSPHQSDRNIKLGENIGDVVSQTSSSLFDRNTFQQFSQQRLSQIMKNNEYHKMIQFREECLVFRERKEKKALNKLLSENQMTPRTYQQRKQKIEKWVSVQRAEIEKTKQGFKEEWEKTIQMIEDTQKNVDHMRIKIASAINTNGADSNSYSQASSRYNNGKPPRSQVLIDEAPKSYRSGYQEPKPDSNNILEDASSLGVLSARRAGLHNLAEKTVEGGQNKFDNHSTSKSDYKKPREGRERSSSDVLNIGERQQSMTGGKVKETDRLIDGSHLNKNGRDNFDIENQSQLDQLPSAAFLNRLEKATNGLLPQNSAEGTLNIEEHYFADDPNENQSQDDLGEDRKDSELKLIESSEDTFEDGNFKNRLVQIKGINQLFSNDSNGNSDAVSDHKSEPQMFDQAEISEDTQNNLKISEMLRKKIELRLQLNYEDETELIQEPAIISNNNKLIPAVTKPVPPQSSLQSDEYKLKLVDQITEQLITQMLKESLELPSREQKKTSEKSAPQPQPDQDIYVIDSLAMDKEEKKEWIEIRQRHLIEGSLIRADQYVNEMLDVLLQFDISDISENSDFDYEVKPTDNFHIQFLKLLTQPIQRPAIDSLALMQTSELGSYNHFETTLDVSKHPIVPVDLYLEIEKAREESLQVRRKNADKKTLQVWESVHIFNKCIFDAINESLMKFRPYGIVGEPMPWSSKVRRLQTKVEIASVDTERLFQMVKQEIFRWTQVFCGCLPGPVFYFPNPRTGKDEFQEDLLQEVRERRLTSVLTQDTVEHEHHWLNYEFEETQVKVDLSDMILEQLVGELIQFMQQQQQSNVEC